MSETPSTRTPSELLALATLYDAVADLLLDPDEEVCARLASGEVARSVERAGAVLGLASARALADALDGGGAATLALDLGRAYGPSTGAACPPYSTEYDPGASFRKEHELADIAGFYAAWRVELTGELHERIDHFGVEAAFLSFMTVKHAYATLEHGPARVEQVRAARARFAREYVAPAAREFAERLHQVAGDGVPARAAELLADLLALDLDGLAPRRRIVSLPVLSP